MFDQIFIDGWQKILLLYGIVFLLVEYAVYNIIFIQLIGAPDSYRHEDIRFFHRKASFASSVIFAPLFEELMFTLLAYASFLQFAKSGQEGLVILLVATVFALLHLPGDIQRQRYSFRGINLFSLLIGQLSRFFYSLTAYFVFLTTGSIWASIVLHYIANAMVSFYNWDIEDGFRPPGLDLLALLILGTESFFTIFACLYVHTHFSGFSIFLTVAGVIYLLTMLQSFLYVQRHASRRRFL